MHLRRPLRAAATALLAGALGGTTLSVPAAAAPEPDPAGHCARQSSVTVPGRRDALLPISTDSDVYAEMVEAQHRDRLHRYYVVEGGNHVDSRDDRAGHPARDTARRAGVEPPVRGHTSGCGTTTTGDGGAW